MKGEENKIIYISWVIDKVCYVMLCYVVSENGHRLKGM